MTPLVYTMPRGTAQIDDVSTWMPPSLHTPWQNVFFEYIKQTGVGNVSQMALLLSQVLQTAIQVAPPSYYSKQHQLSLLQLSHLARIKDEENIKEN